MNAVVGLDAAWTATNPSGVSLMAGEPGNWKLLAVASSYGAFHLQAGLGRLDDVFDARILLDSAMRLAGERATLIAADIPLAHSPIVGRREADNAVSRLYGARHAGTHTPSALRPGALADRIRADLLGAGYPLRTIAPAHDGLIEVYPHPALIELTGAKRRLPYKIGKIAKYWPGLSAAERRARLLDEWRTIVAQLDLRVEGVAALLPAPDADAPARVLKAYEDALDAVVCGWIGTCVIEGAAVALGDADAAIWIPKLTST